MSKCKICDSHTRPIIDFGKMPIANAFVSDLNAKEFFYHMTVVFCPKCYMVQLDKTVPPEMMFNENYAFISSTSKVMSAHFKNFAKEILDETSHKKDPFIVELGSNDGIMLTYIAQANTRHLGVEPASNVAKMAREIGVNTITNFFNKETAREIVEEYGKADVIASSSAMCHIENLNSVFEGISVLLKDDGVLHFEDPYIYDIIRLTSFDQMYDEHVYYFSGLSISHLAKKHGLQLVDMKHQDIHGGAMRYYIKKGNKHKVSKSAASWIGKERKAQLDRLSGYKDFKERTDKICTHLKSCLTNLRDKGHKIVGYGATSKSTTLFNYTKIGADLIEYISDITPTKIGKYTPGMHIPVKTHEHFTNDHPPYVLLLAWNHKKEIFAKEKEYRKKGGKFIIYFPKVIIE